MRPKPAPRGAFHTPQRGLRRLPDRPDRPSPYGLEWSERTTDPATGAPRRLVRRQFFPTAAAREARLADLARARRTGATRALTRAETDDWLAFRAAIGATPWPEVVAAWRAHRATLAPAANTTTVAEHARGWLAARAAAVLRRELAADTQRQTAHKVNLLVATHGDRRLADLTTAELRAWLEARSLAAPATWNNYRKIFRAFFAAAVRARLRPDNPAAEIERRRETPDEVGILTIPEIARLFATALASPRHRITLRRLALETFAGLRHGSANRLRPEDINTADRGIRHPARSLKTLRRHYTSGFPPNLWAWLAVAPDDAALTPRAYLALKSELFHVARVPHPHNCLRHSFATYHLAARKDPGLTAYLLCHRGQHKLWENYKGNATAADGRRFEKITPASCVAMAREHPTAAPAEAAAAAPPPAPPSRRNRPAPPVAGDRAGAETPYPAE